MTAVASVFTFASMTSVSDTEELVDTRGALNVLGRTSPTTISRLVKAGKLTPVHKLPGLRGAYVFRRSDVLALRGERAA